MAKKKYDLTVFIGRFQPYHNAHKQIVETALKESGKVLVIVGSHRTTPSFINPFTSDERISMIRQVHSDEQNLHFAKIRDYLYNNSYWIANIQAIVDNFIDEQYGHNASIKVRLIGHFKDKSSEYLDFFPQWELTKTGEFCNGLSATDVRNMLYEDLEVDSKYVPEQLVQLLNVWKQSESALVFANESKFCWDYKSKWSGPYAINHNATDAIVIKAGHVLVIQRGRQPGLGLYALPGGFLEADLVPMENAIKELKEETKIRAKGTQEPINKKLLERCITKEKVYAHPSRDARGRIISHAFMFNLDSIGGGLPSVEAADDANKALWMPLAQVAEFEDKFFSDHVHIIRDMTGILL